MDPNLVNITEYKLKGSNFYWNKHAQYDITLDELLAIGVTDDTVLVHRDLIAPLQAVNRDLEKAGYSLYIKEGYRSAELYKLVYEKRVVKFGKEKTDQLLNMQDMPHSTGKSVDVTLVNIVTNTEVYLRNGKDDPEAFFIDFYRNKTNSESKLYQQRQDLLINTMTAHGFTLGKLNEYFHFNYIGF